MEDNARTWLRLLIDSALAKKFSTPDDEWRARELRKHLDNTVNLFRVYGSPDTFPDEEVERIWNSIVVDIENKLIHL